MPSWESVLDALAERLRAQQQAIELHGVIPAELIGQSIPMPDGEMPEHLLLRGLALLQSLLVGSLLHVVLHAHVPAPRGQGRFRVASVLGGAAGVFVLWYVMRDHFPKGEHGGPWQVFVQLAIESAPALLFAYVLVGFCHAFLPASWLRSMQICVE